MAYYTGPAYRAGLVSLVAPEVDRILTTPIHADVRGEVEHYLASAAQSANELYFCIYLDEQPVGQILLHDMDWESGESLVGYALFDPSWRGRGIGTQALRLLQHYVVEQTTLKQLFIITDQENLASQGVARNCGFTLIGAAREDLNRLLVFAWSVAGS